MNTTHTPTPWHTGGTFHYPNKPDTQNVWSAAKHGDQSGHIVCEQAEIADAAFIVKACNAHDDLVAALMKIAGSDERPGHVAYIRKGEVARIARAALAKAGAA